MLQTWRIYSCTHYKRIVLISNAHKLVTPNYLKTTNGWRFKSVWLLWECLKFYQFRHLPRSSKWLQQFCSQMTLNLIYFQIYPQLSILNEKGVFFLLRDSNLLGHLCAIRRYLFFGDQEFSHNLCSSLFFEMTLHPNTKWGPGNKSNAFSLSKRILNNFDSENTHHRGGVFLYCWPPIYFVWLQLLCLCWISIQHCLCGQTQTSQRGGQPYRDTSPYGESSLLDSIKYLYPTFGQKQWLICNFFIKVSSVHSSSQQFRHHHSHQKICSPKTSPFMSMII